MYGWMCTEETEIQNKYEVLKHRPQRWGSKYCGIIICRERLR